MGANGFGNIGGYLVPQLKSYIVQDERDVLQWRWLFFLTAGINLLFTTAFNLFALDKVQAINYTFVNYIVVNYIVVNFIAIIHIISIRYLFISPPCLTIRSLFTAILISAVCHFYLCSIVILYR